MTTVNDLHPKAMDLAELAFQRKREGQDSQAKQLFLQALALEREAALLLPVSQTAEPSRSILFRSAASLAYNAEEYETAEQLIAHGLSGFPPFEIKEELENLYEQIESKLHRLRAQIQDLFQQGIHYQKELLKVLDEWPIGEYSTRISFDYRSEPDKKSVHELLSNIERWINSLGVYVLPRTGHDKKKLKDMLSRIKRIIFEEEYKEASRWEAEKVMDEALSLILSISLSPLGRRQAQRTLVANSAFIVTKMSPDQPDLVDTYEAIKEVCLRFGIQAFRADDIEHQGRLTDVILQKIRESEIVIADLTNARPNVYYEMGYAHALNIRPILFRKAGTELHFNLTDDNVPEYKDLADLQRLLHHRLKAIFSRKVA